MDWNQKFFRENRANRARFLSWFRTLVRTVWWVKTTSDHKNEFYDVLLSVWYPLLSFSFANLSVDLYKSVTHISFFMSWTLLNQQENPEDEDSDFYVINDESEEEDNHFRQEYDTNWERMRLRQKFVFVNSCVVFWIFTPQSVCTDIKVLSTKVDHGEAGM